MKNGVNINNRLIETVSFIDKCHSVADIGSDHGYSSIYIVENNIAENVIATDISRPSLSKTEKIVREHNLSDNIQCRVGNGLCVLAPDEVDGVLIAGMGAELIATILSDSENIAHKLKFLVLQPMNSAEPLRKHLVNMGYCITDEGITFDNGKFYQILKCKYGNSKELTDEEYEIGTFVYKKKIPLCEKFVEYKIQKFNQILSYMGNTESEKKLDIMQRLERCRKVLKWINAE